MQVNMKGILFYWKTYAKTSINTNIFKLRTNQSKKYPYLCYIQK